MAAAAAAAIKLGNRSPALLFNNIAGYQNVQIVTNVHGSWANHALALGMDPDTGVRDQFLEFVRRFRMYPGQLERVTSAPWQEVVIDKDINLFEILPLFRWNQGDGRSTKRFR
jgi:UbiD family decarboxylase